MVLVLELYARGTRIVFSRVLKTVKAYLEKFGLNYNT